MNIPSTRDEIRTKNMTTLTNMFETVYPVRRQIMISCSATDLSTLCYAMKFELTEKEKDEFLKPIRDMPVQQDWIRSEVEKGTRISIVGKDVVMWLCRIRDPEQYWNMFSKHSMLRIWLIARRGTKEMEEINNKRASLMADVDQTFQQIIDDPSDIVSDDDMTWGMDIGTYIKLAKTDPKPPGNFISSDAHYFAYTGHSMTQTMTDFNTIPLHWYTCLDAMDNNIELLYMDTCMKVGLYVPTAPDEITMTSAPDGRVGCISLIKNVSKFMYLYPRLIKREVGNTQPFDLAILSSSIVGGHIFIRIGC
jgi:hypothetical protein